MERQEKLLPSFKTYTGLEWGQADTAPVLAKLSLPQEIQALPNDGKILFFLRVYNADPADPRYKPIYVRTIAQDII